MSDKEKTRFRGLNTRTAFVPIAISLGVLLFLFYRRFDISLFKDFELTSRFGLFLSASIFFLILRVLAYTLRLHILTKGYFQFWKSLQLMLIWHFSSAISPTSVGGAAVALLVLSQEKLGAAKTAAVVLYTIVADALFFILSSIFFWCLFGQELLGHSASWKNGFVIAFCIMFAYGLFFFYGAFLKPARVRNFLLALSRFRLLKRYEQALARMAAQFPLASNELRTKSIGFHITIFGITIFAWTCRFLLLLTLIMAFDVFENLQISMLKAFAQIESLYMIMAFSPTPGGSGFAEVLFTDFMGIDIPASIGLLIASIWRILSNYIFIIIGIILVPFWVKQITENSNKGRLTK